MSLQAEISSLSHQVAVLSARTSQQHVSVDGVAHAESTLAIPDEPVPTRVALRSYQEEKDDPAAYSMAQEGAASHDVFDRPVATPPSSRRAMALDHTLQAPSPLARAEGADEVVSRGQIERSLTSLAEDLQLCKMIVQVC